MKHYRRLLTGFALHCILSGVLFSAARVYQKGYNTTHREQIRMAGVVVQEQKADIQILHCHLPVIVPEDGSMLYYTAYLLTDAPLHHWLALCEFIKNS